MGKNYRNHSKTSVNPKVPFEKERLDSELLLVGKYGLKNKREVWRTQYLLARIRKAARELLTLEPTDPRRQFEGQALIDRMMRIGVLGKGEKQLDYVLSLTTQKFLDRRLQTIVHSNQFAKSIHQARTLIFQKKIALNKGSRNQIINIPSFVVRKENELDYVLSLTTQKFLERRLQTIVHANQFSKSIHQARTLIFQKKVALNKGARYQIINIPSFVVRKENETKIIQLPNKEGESRTKKRTKAKKEKGGDAEE